MAIPGVGKAVPARVMQQLRTPPDSHQVRHRFVRAKV
jgi:hypothetical protein